MADFCHEFEPEGLGCPEPHPVVCLGDFTWALEKWPRELTAGFEVNLGICEGHGTCVFLVRGEDGKLYFEHGAREPMDGDDQYPVPSRRLLAGL